MEKFTVQRDNDKDLAFTGELIGSASSSNNHSNGRWTELCLYRTRAGKFVCQRTDRTQWDGERNSHAGAVCKDHNQVVEFFGNGWLAKEVYAEAGVLAQEEI